MSRIRTLEFLPEIFQTPTNSQFLGATLDQLVNPPVTRTIQGYVGSKLGYGVNAKDYYVPEPTKERTDYQLEPGVVFLKEKETVAKDFISYPGIINSLKIQNGITDNNNSLFESQIYSYDSFCSLDPVINFRQYYWLPEGPPAVTVAASTVYATEDYAVTYTPGAYDIKAISAAAGSDNPIITMLRGGTYNFYVDQTTQFWIQAEPGVSGYSATQPNQYVRDIYGVDNNGATNGTVTFNVPEKDAQNDELYPGNLTVNLVSTQPFSSINNALLSTIGNIDGVTSLDGATVIFYNTGDPLYVFNYFYTISYSGDPLDPTVLLTPTSLIPVDEKITVTNGTTFINQDFIKSSVSGLIEQIPFISATLDTLYYQDGTNPNCVGIIKLIENNLTNTIDVETDILGQNTYTAPNGVKFTNGLKVVFDGDVIPTSYLEGEYYVEGVGTAAENGGGIQLVPASSLVTPEPFTVSTNYTYSSLPYDTTPYDTALNQPNTPDYLTIARNSISKNAWARSNRWFHLEVIQASAQYNNDPTILSVYATDDNRAKRPIIQFYPNLKLFNSGVIGINDIDFIDFRTTDAFNYVENQQSYYSDVETYTDYEGTINANTGVIPVTDVLNYQWYQINNLGTTSVSNWTALGAVLTTDGMFDVGAEYVITDVGTTTQAQWNLIAGTSAVVYTTGSTFTAVYTGNGLGTGAALKLLFNTGYNATDVVSSLTIGSGSVINKSITTVEIPVSAVNGSLYEGQWINDMIQNQASRLPPETRILSILESSGTYYATVYYPNPQTISAGVNASFAASSKDNINFALFPGSRIIFANDQNASVRNKIYTVEFNYTGSAAYQVITLTEAPDSSLSEEDMFPVLQGYNYKGTSWYYKDDTFVEAQQKQTVNQAPLFDVFDSDGISYSNQLIYNSSTFKGTKLFAYQISETGINDTILGFPITYSSFNNVNDIRFENTLYKDTFTYVLNGSSTNSDISNGFVYNYITRTTYDRLIGWQTAIAPSQQYQVFQFTYTAGTSANPFVVTCDVPQQAAQTDQWPTLKVYNNNELLTLGTDYTVENTDTTTIITVSLSLDVDTVIEALILSDTVSEQAYYTVPVNLSNNPFNTNPEYLDLGDIRGQYQTIFSNNPNMSGSMFGANNYRDLGNVVPYGNRIIQNSASLVLPGAFLRNPETNLFDALLFNSREYIKYKTVLVDCVNRIAENQKYDPATLLDQALDEITSVKSQTQPFFWSDMLPNKSAYITNVYTFFNDQDTSIFGLSKTYNFKTANYNGVLVYLQRKISGVTVTKQLLTGIDYTISTDSPTLTITTDLIAGDKIIVKEYNATYGSYVPNTPTKLGLYPVYIPRVVYDTSYSTPTWFIIGHDGSYTKLYGEYDEVLGMCQDFRDQITLEFETRIYNNLKLSRVLPILPAAVTPGYFRTTPLPYAEFTEAYSTNFLNWVGQNRVNYKTQEYNASNPWTYNYRGSRSRLDSSVDILQGNYRGIYQYFFDTATPNTTPWEMIGYVDQPSWWETRYGPAPYTSDNLILWTDMQNGYDYNNGDPVTVTLFARPGLLNILPVDSAGDLKLPTDCVIGNYNPLNYQRNWIVGDDAPTEYSYRRSSTYPFDLMRLEALIKPANFYNLAVDLDNYKYNEEFNQFLVNGRTHLIPSDIEVYGNGTAKTSYLNWIVDYQKQVGVDATTKITSLLDNLDVRLVYRLAGFSDKTLLKFFVEKGTLASPNPSLLIPDESYQVLLYNNQPSDKIIYSGVIIQKTYDGYYQVFGNNAITSYFKILRPVFNGKKTNITVQDITVSVPNEYGPELVVIPYGTVFYTEQEVAQFLLAYGRLLESQGMKFEYQINAVVSNWVTMTQEFLYWAQSGWSASSVITLNPAAENLTIDQESLIVQPLTVSGTNFILNNNMYPIQNKDLSIFRDGTKFDVKPLNEGDSLSYGQFDMSNIEHGIVFNNVTLFNDVIYNLSSGLKQNRIYVRGTKSAEWNGTMFASGFIYNQDNIKEWQQGVKYTQGSIVKYKNRYWTALQIVQPNSKFVENEWKQTDYNEIQKGLLPNSSTRSAESALYYNSDSANLEQDADLLSFSLIGFRPRDYMASADLTDITQVNVYKNLIKDKGTLNAMKAFKGANLPQGGIDYDIYENWAIQQAAYGGLSNNNFVEFRLQEKSLTGNPAIVGLTNGEDVEGAQQLVPIYSLFNYGQPVTTANVFPLAEDVTNSLYKDAGYVNVNDVKMMAYFYANLPTAVNKNNTVIPLERLYVNNYVWLANYNSTWQILAPTSIGQVLQVTGNLDGTSTVLFKEDHNLNRFDIFAIINFSTTVNGYFVVTTVKNQREVLINLNLPAQTRSIQGQGIALQFQSHRVDQPSDIQNLPLLNNEFVKNTAWVDTGANGNWAVYRKSINYQYGDEFTQTNSDKFGTAVAYSPLSGYLISDAPQGKVYRYQYNELQGIYQLAQTLTSDSSFGTAIAHEQNIYAISQPDSTGTEILVYAINNITENKSMILLQSLAAPSGPTDAGAAMAMSGDLNWLFVSDYDDLGPRNNVLVYRRQNTVVDVPGLSPDSCYKILDPGTITNWNDISDEVITGTAGVYFKYNGNIPDGTGSFLLVNYQYVTTLTSGSSEVDRFGYSISTNYYGTEVIIGAPKEDYNPANINDWGRTYVYNRLVQVIPYNENTNPVYTLAWTPGSTPVTVSLNGTEVDNTNYTIVGNTLTYTGSFQAGDRLTVSGCEFINTQVLETEQTPRIGVGFGTSVDSNTHATEVVVGAPFALSSNNQEGAAFRFTNAGAKFGVIIGTNETSVTTTRTVLINGYAVNITAGDAANAADIIANANVPNVTATASSGMLVISIVNQDIAQAEQKLILSADSTTLAELGLAIYTQTQIITCPHITGPTQFGTVVKFNESDSVAISAPVGTRYEQTLFDFTDDENLDNDTVFDNNSTQFIDSYANAGAVYTYDLLENYNESLANIGAFTYAQSVNAKETYFGSQPRYGSAIDWNSDRIIIGAPDYRPDDIDGQVITYVNSTGLRNWAVYRYPGQTVDINKIQNIQLFSAETNNTLANLDYIDPLQNKILGAVRQNIDVVSNFDPANYNNNEINNSSTSGIVWGADQVGSIWLNTANFKYLNYNQNENSYNARYWANLFPGSDVAAYTWVASNVEPALYTGPGTPFDTTRFTTQSILNASNVVTPIYYFWVRNTNIVSRQLGKTLADSNIETYIANPQQSGISYLAPVSSNAVALYNSKTYINANDTVLHIGLINGTPDNPSHQEYTLIRQDYAEDFLPGLPGTATYSVPESLYDRMLDSLSGNDEQGQVVPNPFLPLALQSGVLARPRQSFFYNRYAALKNYIQYANEIMATYPIAEIRPLALNGFLQKTGAYYDTTLYWNPVNWWAPGYDDNTKSTIQVPVYADLQILAAQNIAAGTIVTVTQGLNSIESEIYRYDGENVWTRIGLINGTIEFDSSLYDYASADTGFGATFYDTEAFDTYPSQETRWIVRALTEQIYTDDLLIYRNKSLILLFEYIQIETIENQNYVPWLNKTSLVDVSHKIRELLPIQNYRSDNQEFLSGYLNETKPYHVVIKEFLFDYTGSETYQGDITDFDVPAQFDTTVNNFVSPQLIYTEYGNDYQYPTTASIWQTQNYNQWFNNFGLSVGYYADESIVGQSNYPITKLASYMTLSSAYMVVDNIQGLPINGVLKLYNLTDPTTFELIAYSNIDRENNIVSGLSRGYNNTDISEHIPGNQIYIDLPPVVLFNGGKGYINAPRVTAVIPSGYPEPRVAAEFQAVISGAGKVTEILVTNPGSGYVVTPTLEIETAISYNFSSTSVNVVESTLSVYAPNLSTGDLIKYTSEGDSIGGLKEGEWYYVRVLDTSPTSVVALYSTYADAQQDQNRVIFLSQGTGTQFLNIGARAFVIPSATPVRENNITLRYDRTSFNTQVQDWTPDTFYGSEFVGYYTESASSSLSLTSTQPDINNILASAEGTVFPVVEVTNDREIIWSSGTDSGLRAINKFSPVGFPNQIQLSYTASVLDEYPSGSTIGFYVGMPVKFTATEYNIIADTTYYVKEIFSLDRFSISATQGGAVKILNSGNASADMKCATGTIIDTAVITTVYPGIREVTATSSTNNILTVPLTYANTSGTTGLYTNVPVHFTGTTFGGIEQNLVYFVVSVLDSTHFTIATETDPVTVKVLEANSSNEIICESVSGLEVNDPIVFDNIVINDVAASSFGNIQQGQIYYVLTIDGNVITISATLAGTEFVTGTVSAAADTYCFITSQANCKVLSSSTGSMTMNIGMPVSPGQVDGQQFAFYPSTWGDVSTQYYLKVDTATTFKVYSDPRCTVPVSGIDFPYTTGDWMLLPEPFYFKPSIVKYNGRVWLCVVSNNDPEFVMGNWQLLNSGDHRLNALDRAKGYYDPTVNMPGYDLTQLFTGLTYPNATYRGNAFELDQQFALDTQLLDQAFTPTNINIPAILFDGTNYLAPANTPSYSGMIADLEVTDNWLLSKMANQTLALTDIIYANGSYVMTSNNTATPVFKSNNYQVWSTTGYFVPFGTATADVEYDKKRLIASALSLNAVAEHDGTYVAVGDDIIVSDDLVYWYERFKFEIANCQFYDVTYVDIPGFTGFIAVGVEGLNNGLVYASTDGELWTDVTPSPSYNFYGVTADSTKVYVVGENKILSSSDLSTWDEFSFVGTFNKITFADGTLVAVGDYGLLYVSTDGITWTQKDPETLENLNNVIYVEEQNQWNIVGDNNTVLQTNDITASPVVWDTTQLFRLPDPDYTVQGSAFTAGYGPEELVPGIVSDQLTMIVTTKPGSNWPANEYAHVGYNVVSLELDYSSLNIYSFKNAVQTPCLISAFTLDQGLSETLYENVDYTIDWVNKTITLTPNIDATKQVRIDVYETGNGDQLVESSTDESAMNLNEDTGFQEIQLNCNYVGLSYTGGGIVYPGTEPLTSIATATDTTDDTISVSDTDNFSLNSEIYFTGAVFGGVVEGTVYYVKSINTVAGKITISDTQVGGVAGPVYNLITDTGSMDVIIQRGPGELFTPPAVFYNGNFLVSGHTNYVTATSSMDNSITTFTTSNLTVDQKIVFSDLIFGGISAQTTYYIKDILSATSFTISATQGGAVETLSSANGLAIFVTNDYAVAVADNQVSAKMILASQYDLEQDYIAFTFFNQTDPQYGYTIPLVQKFTGNGTVGPYDITGYLGGTNIENAVVEVNGLRISPSEYTLSFAFQKLLFNSLIVGGDELIAVTTYNDTSRQYLFTNTYTNTQVNSISDVDNSLPTASITTSVAHNLATDDVVRIEGVLGSTQLNGRLFVVEVTGTTTFNLQYYTSYGQVYDSGNTSVNVTGVDDYEGSGYVTEYQTYVLENTTATANDATYITVDNVLELVAGTPVYFTENGIPLNYPLNSIPELIANQQYFILEVNQFTNEISVSETRDGSAVTLTPGSGYSVRVTQWQQTNVDRLWVTVNGHRVASSKLVLNETNEVNILTEILPTDEVVITSMMPSATPNSQTYIQIVDKDNQGAVYRANPETTTWNTTALQELTTTMTVNDLESIVSTRVQEETVPAAVGGFYTFGINANRNEILDITVYNNTQAIEIEPGYYSLVVTGLGPTLEITQGSYIAEGDTITVTVVCGNTIYINGEYMNILAVDTVTKEIEVARGAFNSPVLTYIPVNSTIYSFFDSNRMTYTEYIQTWNPVPGLYNTALGDPLQIAESSGAEFLRRVVR